MDCFYAAVHVRDDPRLAGRPVVVGGDPESRGVVAAASYEARRYGIHSAMPAAHARRLCPQAVFLRPEFTRYRQESEKIFDLYREYTPDVQTLSLDEAYLDVTDHLGEHGSATSIAKEIRRRVTSERGLTVSVGIGPNKLVAKIASDYDKPDGLCVVRPSQVQAFLAPLSVRRLYGIGPATEKTLKDAGIETVEQLRQLSLDRLLTSFGSWGRTLYEYARGIDERPVRAHGQRKSLSTERTFPSDLSNLAEMDEILAKMAEEVSSGLGRRRLAGCTVTLKVRFSDFRTLTRSHTFPAPIDEQATLYTCAAELLRRTEAPRRPVRLLGLGVSNLIPAEHQQLELFTQEEGASDAHD